MNHKNLEQNCCGDSIGKLVIAAAPSLNASMRRCALRSEGVGDSHLKNKEEEVFSVNKYLLYEREEIKSCIFVYVSRFAFRNELMHRHCGKTGTLAVAIALQPNS